MIKIVACGKIRESWMKEGIKEYSKRIQAFDKFEIVEVNDEKAPENNSDAQNEQVKMEEGKRLLKQIKDDEYVILLDLKGKQLSSTSLSEKMEKLYQESKNKITFVIGGSLGVSEEVKKRANFTWQISECTFPHQLCRLLLCEQIYRSCMIMHHKPYHK